MLPAVEVLTCELARGHQDRLVEGRRPYRANKLVNNWMKNNAIGRALAF